MRSPAVSVRRRAFPRFTGRNPWVTARAISSGEKSPSGPTSARMSVFG